MIVLNTEISREPALTAATLIHHLVSDLLHQSNFEFVESPELVDVAVIGTGLGLLQSSFVFVQQGGTFWDSTYWTEVPRPFLNTHALAYSNALAAWFRDEKNPDWVNELSSEIKRPMQKSLKFLVKTNDSFFHPNTADNAILAQPHPEWLKLAADPSTSNQIIAVRHFGNDESIRSQQEEILVDKLKSTDRAVVLNSIRAIEATEITSEPIAIELRMLAEDSDDEVRCKAMVALARGGMLDEETLRIATKMVGDNVKHVIFAGMLALSAQETISDDELRVAERGFIRALQTVDYEFIGLFASAFHRWLDDPQSRIQQLLHVDYPEYLELATDALAEIESEAAPSS